MLEVGFFRLKQILGDPKAEPPIPAIIPVSASTWWAGVASGRFPPAKKLLPGVTLWNKNDIYSLVEEVMGCEGEEQ
ncbi:MAG: transcriptional regulator [Acidiferrobacteraceae bacterium]|nr:transcriptional regulator [Acidiferrobacteraceae bacterium]